MKSNETEQVCYPQPRTTEERVAIARDFARRFEFRLPLVVDPIEDPVDAVYAGWPERLYVVDRNGRVAYKGKTGPFGYEPDEVEDWLARRFGEPVAAAAEPRPGG